MSSHTWTPAALSSERRRLSGVCWRIVEAQHKVSTLKLVDTLGEQELLERLVERAKPPVPPECQHLHYLLATPFRYGAPYPRGSRFRRAGLTSGVYYASASPDTAIAETAFYRLLFFAESPTTRWPANAAEFTAFSVRYATAHGLDLTKPPLSRDRTDWTHLTSYEPCQAIAEMARVAGIDALKYESVRDPERRPNLALLACRVFGDDAPIDRHTWRIQVGPNGAQAVCEFPDIRLEFTRDAFAADPRIAALNWERN